MLAAGQRVYLHGGDFASAAIIQIIPFSLFQCLYLPVSRRTRNWDRPLHRSIFAGREKLLRSYRREGARRENVL